MKIKRLSDLAEDPSFIKNVYNYCDRWCDRCPFTSRCIVYSIEHERRPEPGRDAGNQNYWCSLESVLVEGEQMLGLGAHERKTFVEAPLVTDSKSSLLDVEVHALTRSAMEYAQLVAQWLDTESHPPALENLHPAGDRDAAFEVICQYQNQISTKLIRGMLEFTDQDPYQSAESPLPCYGSIKVALIAIDRSIGAWGILSRYFPNRLDTIRTMVSHLEDLRRCAEACFPGARSFLRPGFDDMPTIQ